MQKESENIDSRIPEAAEKGLVCSEILEPCTAATERKTACGGILGTCAAVPERRIAYSGIPGAYADIAAGKIFREGRRVAYPSFGAVYAAVAEGACDYGVFPIENSFAGDVAQVLDLLYFGGLFIAGIYEMPIAHCLLGVAGASLSDIRQVTSHPQALDQCAGFLSANGFAQVAATNTAVAARRVAEAGDISLAAIASLETAKTYGLQILAQNINEKEDNRTRFAVVSRERKPLVLQTGTMDSCGKEPFGDALRNVLVEACGKEQLGDAPRDPPAEAFALVFTVKNEAGALARAVTAIGGNGFNMRAIRSRPSKELAWNYYFFVEGEGNLSGDRGQTMLKELAGSCEVVRLLGNYPADVRLV